MRHFAWFFFAVLFAVGPGCSGSHVSPPCHGCLDVTFGNGGEWRPPEPYVVGDVLVDPQDRIVFTASHPLGAVIGRLTTDGETDTTFGDDGFVTLTNRMSAGLIRVSETNLYVLGGDDSSAFLQRFDDDGALDGTFGQGGWVRFGPNETISAMTVDSEGRIIVVGDALVKGVVLPLVVRVLPDGTFDPWFGSGGRITTPGPLPVRLVGVAVRKDGRIIALGDAFDASSLVLAAYTPTGTDPTFGMNGFVVPYMGGTHPKPSDIVLSSTGEILTLWVSITSGLARFRADGTLDPTFGGDGLVGVEGPNPYAFRLSYDPNGDIILIGVTGPGEASVWKFHPDGSPYVGFGNKGRAGFSFNERNGYTGGLLSDGRIILGGGSSKPAYRGGSTESSSRIVRMWN